MLFDIDYESEPRERRAHLEGLREVITIRLAVRWKAMRRRVMRSTTLCAAALVIFLPSSAVAQEWRGLVVAPEERCAPYDASEYYYPQSVEPRIADSLGGVYSPYTCEMFGALNETDIEHIVARSEAHDSGLCAASPERKSEFSRDLRNLTLSALFLNRNVKGAKDAADWTPDENGCWFAWRVIDVRRAYGLTIDRREATALDAILAACSDSSPNTQPACPNILSH